LLKASVGAEIFDEEWHPIVTKGANSTNNVAVRATMCRRDIDLLQEGLSVKFARVSRAVHETAITTPMLHLPAFEQRSYPRA